MHNQIIKQEMSVMDGGPVMVLRETTKIQIEIYQIIYQHETNWNASTVRSAEVIKWMAQFL